MFASFLRSCALCGLGLSLNAFTAQMAHAELQSSAFEVPSPEAPTEFGAAVSPYQLAEARGGSFNLRSQIDITGSTEGNSAQEVVTGNNLIEAGSFEQMSGIPVVVQNSGANVLIQNAVIINMQME